MGRFASCAGRQRAIHHHAVMAELKPQLRALLNYHCGVGTLRTRQMMIDLQSL